MSNRILFISDLHLEESRPDITKALFGFLDANQSDCSSLYILGDLFDTWIGDDNETPLNISVANALSTFQQAGSLIHILHGNRDFLLGPDYLRRCHASLIQDPVIIASDIGAVLVLHGDSLCTDDVDYIKFRDSVRDIKWQQDFLSKTLDERRAFAEQARLQSQKATSAKDNAIMDVNAHAVEELLIDRGQTLMIHGHTHRPHIHDIQLSQSINGTRQARRVVLGDWDKNGWYAEISREGLRLEKFPL